MAANGHDWTAVWAGIRDLVCKSIVAIQPLLAHHYRASLPAGHAGDACFELLGMFMSCSITGNSDVSRGR